MSTLSMLLLTADQALASFVRDTLKPWGDEVIVEQSSSIAIEAAGAADVVLVDLTLEDGAGLAVAHFLAARDTTVPVLGVSAGGDSEIEAVAHALGVHAVLPRPLTGDALLMALSRTREGRSVRAPSPNLHPVFSATPSLVPRFNAILLDPILAATSLNALAQAIAHSAFMITGHGARVRIENARFETIEAAVGPPSEKAYDELSIASRDESLGTLYVVSEPATQGALVPLVQCAGSVGVLLRAQESAARAGIKDPETSAYTFAYFVDAAGREVERAQRNGRRFGLLTFQLDHWSELRQQYGDTALHEARRELVDTILDTAADTDILALVEDDELYLLSPESGRLRTFALRRRIAEKHRRRAELARLEKRLWFSTAIGAAAFPRDGRDLATLARAASARGRRAEEHEASWRDPNASLDASLGALLRLRPGAADWGLRQGAMSSEALQSIALVVSREAVKTTAAQDGVAYLLGPREHPIVAGAYEAMKRAPAGALPCFWLRPGEQDGHDPSSPGIRLSPVEIEVDATRTGPFALLAVLTEWWAYACVSSAHGAYKRVMHTSDLEIVESLVAEVQKAFHLQREGE
jgi:GGDEF domain-containing protein/ActR/RegA family two-component response regulator